MTTTSSTSSTSSTTSSAGSSIISALSAGSGVDTSSLVTQLVAAQYANKTAALTSKSNAITTQISDVGSLLGNITSFNSSLSSLISGGTLASQPASSNTNILTVTAQSGAKLNGLSTSLEVRQLASAQAATSAPVSDRTAAVGSGSFTLTFGTATSSNGVMTGFTAGSGTPVTISIGSDNSLDGIAKAINAANAGVTATVVTDADGARLSVKGATGAAQAFTLNSTDAGLSQFNVGVGSTLGTSAQDAIIAIDGTAVKRPSNTVNDLIDGVNINLVGAQPGTTVSLTSATPSSAITAAVNNFVDTFNQLQATVKTDIDPVAGTLRADSAANSISRQLAAITLTPLAASTGDGAPTTLAEIGVGTNRDGTLKIDSDRLAAAIQKYPAQVEALFAPGTTATNGGLGGAFNAIATFASDKTVGLTASQVTYTNQQDTITDQQTELTTESQDMTDRLTKQFASMDARVAAYKSTLTFLQSQIDAWNKKDS
jgi:flagellar hook-associated protein 2